MTKDDYGIAPMKAKDAVIFYLPSLGEEKSGRVFIYDNKEDLEEMKMYYDEIGKASALFFSWTAASGKVLLQINGDMSEEEFNKYKDIVENF